MFFVAELEEAGSGVEEGFSEGDGGATAKGERRRVHDWIDPWKQSDYDSPSWGTWWSCVWVGGVGEYVRGWTVREGCAVRCGVGWSLAVRGVILRVRWLGAVGLCWVICDGGRAWVSGRGGDFDCACRCWCIWWGWMRMRRWRFRFCWWGALALMGRR